MKVLSLFDGISCGMVALERVGIKVEKYVAYEIDEDAINISHFNYPSIEHKGNVFNAKYWKGEFDLLIGGSPCTYWSIAKAGNGGTREITSSGLGWELFSQYVRALREVQPTWFLYENNVSMSDDIKNEITKALGVEPYRIDSKDFSAQYRERYYWTNIPIATYGINDDVVEDIIFDDNYKVKDFEKYASTMIISKDGMACKWDSSGKGYYSQQNRARKKQIKMNTVTARGSDKCNIWLGGYKFRHLHPIEAERLQTLPDNYTKIISDSKRIKVIGNGWTVDVIAHIFKGLNN